ncbi:MAG: ABC transporter ATP-binding protein [Desulfobulbaceae bacterium]|nr:MAG: ABC transporter ATP-binding protein [Desulfobulbaceae bacterium]
MLEVKGIDTYYGQSQALYDLSLSIGESEVVTLLGRNGMGKSTTVRSIMGLTRIRKGEILYQGQRIDRLKSYQIARFGIGLVPEGRQIFPNLSVKENLIATASNYRSVSEPYQVDDILTIFPRLKERMKHFGNQLSGGEQQMLAIGRALMINPQLLILDEATEGLAPLIRNEIWRGLGILKSKGLAILVIDKNLEALFELGEHHNIMEKGSIVWTGNTSELAENSELKSRYLGV